MESKAYAPQGAARLLRRARLPYLQTAWRPLWWIFRFPGGTEDRGLEVEGTFRRRLSRVTARCYNVFPTPVTQPILT